MRRVFRRILVGISDPRQSNRNLLGKAARLAARGGARVYLVHSYTAVPVLERRGAQGDSAAYARNYELAARKQLERMAAPLRRRGIRVEASVINDMPAHEALVRQIRLRKAELLMVQLHRHPRWTRWFLTYTDWELIRHCACPVWMVKGKGSRTVRSVAAAVDPLHPRAGAAKLDDRILETARQVAGLLGGKVTLCHVADLPFTYGPGGLFGEPVPVPAPRDVQRRHLAHVEATIRALARKHGLPASRHRILPGLPGDLLPRIARNVRAELLVMGAVSRSGLDRLFIGSTAERIIDRVECDLLIVKPRAFRSRVPARRRIAGLVVP